MSSSKVKNPVVFFTDLEPLYKDLVAVISKAVDIQDSVPILRCPKTGKFIGYAGNCRTAGENGLLPIWEGTTEVRGPVYSLNGNVIYGFEDRTLAIDYVKNSQVFNFAITVLDAIIARSRTYNQAGKVIYFSEVLKDLITPENYRFNAEQHAYYQTRQRLRHDIVSEIVEQEKRNRLVKFNPMTVTEEQNFYHEKGLEFDMETRNVVFRDDVTVNAIEEIGDQIMLILRDMNGYGEFIAMLQNNEWAIFSTELGHRIGRPYCVQMYFCGDLRIIQWEKEHLHEYPNIDK